MCVRKDYISLTNRYFTYLFCHRYVYFKASKKYDESLCFEIEISKGEFSIELLNRDTKKVELLNNFTSPFEFKLEKGMHYRIHIEANAASGHYKIYRKRKIA